MQGFRSARFGMNEASVRAVIPKDLDVAADAVKTSENLSQQTHVLTVRAADVLPGGGAAEVAYVFGYKTKKLIQVGIVWTPATDAAITPERLFSNGNILRAHFIEDGDYKAETIITDAAVKNGLMMFRGSDAQGHTTVLLLQGQMSAPASATSADKDKRVLTPKSLSLIYLSDPKNPDVYRLTPGQF